MVAWFLIAIATLIVFAFIAVSSVQTLAMASDAGGRIETVKRLETVASALISRAASPGNDGLIYLPVGENNPTGAGYGLPSYLGFQTQTAFGQRFVYCPFGDAGGTGTTLSIPNADGTSYSVATAAFEGRDYVVGGRPAYPGLTGQPNLIGFVMAPRSKLSAIPNCSDVVYNSTSRRFEAPDAIVRPLTRENGIDESRTIDARRITFYVSPDGTGLGGSEADPTSFATAINFLKSRQPSSMEIKMASGNYGIAANELNMSTFDNDRGTKLTITGVQNSTFIDLAGTGYVNIPGDVTMNNIIFDTDAWVVVREDASLSIKNFQAGVLQSAGKAVLRGGTNSFTRDTGTYAVMVQPGGEMFVSGTVNFANPSRYGFYVREGGELSLVNATVNFAGTTSSSYVHGIQALDGDVSVTASTLNFPNGTSHGIYMAGGDLTLRNSTMSFGGSSVSAVFLDRGAAFTMYASVLGAGTTLPNYGVRDIGARAVSGSVSEIYASNCWFGGLFSWSPSGTSGNTSDVTAAEPVPTLSASPTNTEVQAYVAANDNNTQRALYNRSNEASWSCM
ncbi:hypothetical protein [Erythrobacter aureus]|uniref:Uncharacterized protein n=1 Tax=Erythrobacter aureus TaxID=2182384 RepID=A0A345YJL7_9SPHN|nr:hypothetical protein [Erythrobacter aureus]AXK44119.1 hypothetical protein DVR09_16840 [Erythrobacter aureus]